MPRRFAFLLIFAGLAFFAAALAGRQPAFSGAGAALVCIGAALARRERPKRRP